MIRTKTFDENPYAIMGLSSMENELYCLKQFSRDGENRHAPKIVRINEDSYDVEEYRCRIGSIRKVNGNVRRVLFSLTFDEFIRQLDEIVDILEEENIDHGDIHPANIILSEKDKCLKLVDFFWAKTDHIEPVRPKKLARQWGNDRGAIKKIKKQVQARFPKIKRHIAIAKKMTESFGRIYYDGSASLPGKTYQKIDIPHFEGHEYHKDTSHEFNTMMSAIDFEPKTVRDIGCASGYTVFNLMRNFILESAIAYEADPRMFAFLEYIKLIFDLRELKLINGVTPQTDFEPVDLTICMNVHMWLVKQFGRDESDTIMRNLIKNTKVLFFQTASRKSNGKYRVKWLNDKYDIENYLRDMGGKNVIFLKTLRRRHLFKVENEA